MLHRLFIKNIALISEADIEFGSKLNVLSGETGSGKSVILDSINFVLGSKADKTMIRYGEQEAMVRAEFAVEQNSEVLKKLEEFDIESDGNIIITRKFGLDGKGSIKINGNTVTAFMLKSVTQHLVDVHGQSEHFFLLGEDNQLKVIDGICGEKLLALRAENLQIISKRRELLSKISELGGNADERERKLDILKFQIDEIENAAVRIGEFEELKARRNVIANTEKILSALEIARSVFGDDGGCLDEISSAQHSVNSITCYSEKYSELGTRLEGLYADASDICETLSDFAEEMTFDGREIEEIDERLATLKSLMKKYGADEEQILKFAATAKEQFETLSEGAEAIEKYNNQIAECNKQIYCKCCEMTKLRKAAAQTFCKKVEDELKTLNIPSARFEVVFTEYDENSVNLSSANGSDVVRFMFSANKGEPLKPLSKVISGGEMSRFMLAVKTQLKDLNGISTYIFDEIDVGISGFTANTVAEKFNVIANSAQILAVSHLPQVCAASSTLFLIYKEEENGKVLTKVKRLDDNQKIAEIVRLTGSIMSEAAIQHAKELIDCFKH